MQSTDDLNGVLVLRDRTGRLHTTTIAIVVESAGIRCHNRDDLMRWLRSIGIISRDEAPAPREPRRSHPPRSDQDGHQ